MDTGKAYQIYMSIAEHLYDKMQHEPERAKFYHDLKNFLQVPLMFEFCNKIPTPLVKTWGKCYHEKPSKN